LVGRQLPEREPYVTARGDRGRGNGGYSRTGGPHTGRGWFASSPRFPCRAHRRLWRNDTALSAEQIEQVDAPVAEARDAEIGAVDRDGVERDDAGQRLGVANLHDDAPDVHDGVARASDGEAVERGVARDGDLRRRIAFLGLDVERDAG